MRFAVAPACRNSGRGRRRARLTMFGKVVRIGWRADRLSRSLVY